MIDFNTDKIKGLFIPLPVKFNGVNEFIIKQYGYAGTWFEEKDCKELNAWKINLPKGEYKFIGTTMNMDDKAIKEIIDDIHVEEGPSPGNDFAGGYHYAYVDYENRGEYAGYQGDAGCYRKPKDSLESLMKSLDISTDINYAIVVTL